MTLHLKSPDSDAGIDDYTTDWRVRDIIKRHSDFVSWPIRLHTLTAAAAGGEQATTSTGITPDAADDAVDADAAHDAAHDPDGAAGEVVNTGTALWLRDEAEVSAAELAGLYGQLSGDWAPPWETIRLAAEGTFEFRALLFVPPRAPFDLYYRGSASAVSLYVRHVLVESRFAGLLPEYLRFVSGLVDASDLPLNVSRESLAQDRRLATIRRRLTKKVLVTLAGLGETDPERYAGFWEQFGGVVKEGLVTSPDDRETILQAARFASTADDTVLTSLSGYLDRMRPEQEHIYYLIGDDRAIMQQSPHLEPFLADGVEVLLLTDDLDEMWVSTGEPFADIPFRSITAADPEPAHAPDDAGQDGSADQPDDRFGPLLDWLRQRLASDVADVKLSTRLTSSPARLATTTDDSAAGARYLPGLPAPDGPRTLELNPAHPLLQQLADDYTAGADTTVEQTADLLHGMAVLAEGGHLTNPARFVTTLAARLTGCR